MIRKFLAGGALAIMATGAQAGEFDYFDLYFVPQSNLDVNIPGFGSGDVDGDGFGVKGRAHVGETVTLHGEFQSITLDDSDADVDQLRFGIGGHSSADTGARFFGDVEYVSIDIDGTDDDGFGLHGGLSFSGQSQLSGFARLGYLLLDETDGLEFSLGADLAFTPGFGGFIDYRAIMLEDDSSNEIDFTDLRIGVRFHFDQQ
ncbi:hypothetical protein GYB61_08305 [bacterium]|nr:hypothetical protein [bacterium]